MVAQRDLVRISQGRYAGADLADLLQRHSMGPALLAAAAAIRSLGAAAAASHHTAAQVHGLNLLNRPDDRVSITRPPGAGSRSVGGSVLIHSAALPAGHIGRRFGVPVTTVSRTVVDLARTLSFREGVVVADSAIRQQLTSKKALESLVADCPRWPGIRQAREVVDFADGLAESVLESIARVLFRDRGLPAPELQVELGRDGVSYRVDFMWKQFRTIAEVDGKLKYDDRSRFGYERRRDVWLRNAGYEVVHFSWQEITAQPDYVVATLRAAFERGCRAQRSPGQAG
jgi:very-short-patch-repair endonuclease